MTPERWRQIEELFHAVLELPAGERLEFLSSHANGDETLKTEVENLLDQYDEADSFISQPLLDSGKGVLSSLLDESDEDPLTGEVLGSYRIDREIGRGGMNSEEGSCAAAGKARASVAAATTRTLLIMMDSSFLCVFPQGLAVLWAGALTDDNETY